MTNRKKSIDSPSQTVFRITPYLVVRRVDELIDFLKRAFGARELVRHSRSDGTIQHAEVSIGSDTLMLGEPADAKEAMPSTFHVTVNSADATFDRAIRAGGAPLREPADQPQGGRMAGVRDPSGNHWYVVSPVTKRQSAS
jgi:PhnB protein